MKKHAIALAALGLVSGYASAQSSVTLYGVVDVALERVKGATSVTRVTSGQQQGSRWGLRGTEDLGGGLKATFLLESGFNADVGTLGQGGRLFGRQGYVGLGGNWGTVRLGRQYTPMDDIASIIGTKVYDVVSVVPIIGNGDYNRVDNAITYVSPTVASTVFQLQYSLGEERASNNASADFGKQVSAHALYAQGPWTLGLSLMQVADADGVLAGKQGKDALLFVGAYDFGPVKLTGYYDVEDKAVEKLKLFGLAVAFKFGETTVSVGAAQAKNVNGSAAAASDDAKIYTLQATHNLSKRTALYGHLTAVSNDTAAALGFNSPVAGSSSNGIQVGIRHRF
ncbi:MAG: porin [Hydrogenophaga sp.]|uniref:porin n=1 Tax=Hydrogenophaga sp. TaxID=1904254 RepID=UPI0025BAE198|nr:porin [Hydrogenophaga sp.]MBU7572303.1 porin [Hydrogenophaga sp.]